MNGSSLPRIAAWVATVAVVAAARLPGFPVEVAVALGLVAVWRAAGGASGQALLGRRLLLVLVGLTALVGFVVLHDLAAEGPAPLVGLLILVALAQTVCLLRAQTSFVLFLILLLSTIHVAGSAFLLEDGAALVLVLAYLVLLAWALVLFERWIAARRAERKRGAVRRLNVGRADAVPRGAMRRTVAGLAWFGVVGGFLLYVAVPRAPFERKEKEETPVADALPPDGAEVEGSAGAAPLTHFTGPGEKGMKLGDVGRIKRDLTPYLEVTLPLGREVRLRENSYAVYRRGDWSPIATGVPEPWGARPDSAQEGWIPLAREDDPVRGFDVEIRIVRGPQQRLYLARDAVRVRVLHEGRPLNTWIECAANGQRDSVRPLQPDDVVQERAVPPVDDPNALERAPSNGDVAPHEAFVDLPEECRPLVAEANRIVGGERNPWRRARILESWLRSEAFTYTLKMPEVDSTRPVVDFVLRKRRGHCEYFASSLTLLLRALGHPARVVRGFRGGDWQPGRGTWLVRGVHYHAWTEIYLGGLGWTPLDPTPPDRDAIDAKTVTREANSRSKDDGRSLLGRLLGYGVEERRALAEAINSFFRRYVAEPLAFFFGRRSGYAGSIVVALFFVLWVRRGRRRRAARRAGFKGRSLPPGPYGRALGLLARRGLRRRTTQTAREFESAVGRLLPAAGTSFAAITRLYEEERFAGRPAGDDGLSEAHTHLQSLKTATARK